MKFEEALAAMREGKKVKRPEDDISFGMDKKSLVYFRKLGKDYYMFGIRALMNTDITAEDWEVVDD